MIILKSKFFLIPFLFILPFLTSGARYNKTSAYIVMESTSNRILEGENINEQLLVASTAKILTAITSIENYSLDEEIKISNSDVSQLGSRVYLHEGEVITRYDLLHALMLRSANDAASALSGNNSKDFIFKMNETAKKIGMFNSVFENASGLDECEYNLSTAYDMALLSSYALKNDNFIDIASKKYYKCKTNAFEYNWYNKHKLVSSDNHYVWGKTGYTKKSSRILVSNYVNDNMNVVIVTINYSDDWNFHKSIIKKLDDYSFVNVYKKGVYKIYIDPNYYLRITNDIVIPLRKNEYDLINLKFIIKKSYAYLYVYKSNEIICKYKIEVIEKSNLDIGDYLKIYS